MTRGPLQIVLVLLDGLGDRPLPELDERTPAEAAQTPTLDSLAAVGASGVHLPFGWGRAPSSEIAHWSLFGYEHVPFCGRAVLEALGADRDVPPYTPMFYAALRPTDSGLRLGPYAADADADDARELFGALANLAIAHGVRLDHLRRGEAIMYGDGLHSASVTDTEALRPGERWLRPKSLAAPPDPDAAARTAEALEALVIQAHRLLDAHPVNRQRAATGRLPLTALTTKWGGSRDAALPSFREQTGLRGALVTSSGLYRGFARLLAVPHRHTIDPDPAADMARRLQLAQELLDEGAEFVHVHTKVTDEAGHTKDQQAKKHVIEQLDGALAPLLELRERAIVCVTGDHATPSSGSLMHSGDPTPLTVAGPTVRPDAVTRFGERHAAGGAYGQLRASDVLPMLCGHADRARLLGHHPTARDAIAQILDIEPPRLTGPA